MKILKPTFLGLCALSLSYYVKVHADEVQATPQPANYATETIESLTLIDESLPQIVGLLERLTGCVVIVSKDLPKVSINLNIPHALPLPEAIAIIKSTLAANGIAVIPLGDKQIQLLQLNRAKNNGPKLLTVEELCKEPYGKEICSCIFSLNNLTAREAIRVVQSSLTPSASSCIVLDKANSLWITDSVNNLKNVKKVLENVDKVGNVTENILFFNIKNLSAKDLKEKLENLQKGALKRYLLGTTTFEADARTNQLMVVTPFGNEKLIEQYIQHLDVNVGALTRSEVFRIQHGSSKDLTELIKKLVQQQNQQGGNEFTKTNSENSSFSKNLTIECDDRLNAVVVYGTPMDIQQVRSLIEQLDIVLPQVRIEVIIAEVTLSKGQASGLESFGYSFKSADRIHSLNPGFASNSNMGLYPINVKTLTFPHLNFDGILGAAKANSNITIVSAPTLMTTHNREANLKLSEQRPYITSVQTKSGSATTDPDVTNQNIEKADAGIELTIKPLIGLDGIVQLDIAQTVDSFSAKSTKFGNSNISLPHIMRRAAKSFVSIKSGEVIVLGGLKQREQQKSQKKLFVLGELPLIGNLFSGRDQDDIVKELIIFIRPVILSDVNESIADSKQFTEKLSDETRHNVTEYIKEGKFDINDSDIHLKSRKRSKAHTGNVHKRNQQVKKQRPTLHKKQLKVKKETANIQK